MICVSVNIWGGPKSIIYLFRALLYKLVSIQANEYTKGVNTDLIKKNKKILKSC